MELPYPRHNVRPEAIHLPSEVILKSRSAQKSYSNSAWQVAWVKRRYLYECQKPGAQAQVLMGCQIVEHNGIQNETTPSASQGGQERLSWKGHHVISTLLNRRHVSYESSVLLSEDSVLPAGSKILAKLKASAFKAIQYSQISMKWPGVENSDPLVVCALCTLDCKVCQKR